MRKYIKNHFDIVILLFSIVVSAILRIVIPYNMVFVNGRVVFNAVDAYAHMRYVDIISLHPVSTIFYDPYLYGYYGNVPSFDSVIVWLGNIFGNINACAAYLPVILGVFTLIPIFIIAQKIFKNKIISSLSVLFAAIIPGMFFSRTQLGAADHHCVEIFLTTIMMMWIVLVLTDKRYYLKALYGVLAIAFFVLYYWAWMGSFMFLFIVGAFVYVWVSFILWKRMRLRWNVIFHVCILSIGGLIVLLARNHQLGDIPEYLFRQAANVLVWNFNTSVSEEWPLFFGGFSSISGNVADLATVWGYFGFLFYFSLVGLGMLIYIVVKYRRSTDILLLVWSSIMLILTLSMRRWAYYSAINIVMLSALSMYVIGKALIVVNNKVKVKNVIIASLFTIVFIIVPFIRNDVALARNPNNYMTQGWQEATQYLHSQLTSEQDAEYYKVHTDNKVSNNVPMVLSWWDYGYYIVRESHMMVLTHPGGINQKEAAQLLLSEDSEETIKQLKQLNIKYIVIDNLMAVEKFYAIVDYAGGDLGTYYVKSPIVKIVERSGKYYDSFLSRLYFDDGQGIKNIHLVYESSSKVVINDIVISGNISEVKVFEVE